MKFWEKFKALIPLRHVIFILVLFAVTITIFYFDSAEDIKVSFGEDSIDIKASSCHMNIPYDMIDYIELIPMEDGGEKINGSDNLFTLLGSWANETWGQYEICADLDSLNCIMVHLTDGRSFGFSRKNVPATEVIYQQLLTYLPAI